jgi:hypothetical protein
MTKVLCVISVLFLAADLGKGKLHQLRSIETYEIQPGILVMPIYSDAGEVCSIAMEKRHFSSTGIDLDAEMSREEIYRIFDELAPGSERIQSKLHPQDNGETTIFDGGTLTTTAQYENVMLQMYGKYKEASKTSYVAALIQWKKYGCGHDFPAATGDPL